MLTHLLHLIGPPPFADEEQQRVARALFTIQLVLLIAASLAMLIAIFIREVNTVVGLLAGGLATGVTVWLNHRGYTRRGSFGVILILLVLGTFLLLTGQGVHSIAITLYPTLIIVASLLLERRAFLIVNALMLISLGVIVYAEISGWLNTTYPSLTDWSDFALLAVILILTAVTVRFLADSLILNLQRARRNEQALAISNMQLRQETARLEILVDIDRAILNAQTLDSIALAVLERMRSLVPARYAALVLFDFPRERHEAFVIQADRGVEIFREWRPLDRFEIMEPLWQGHTHVVADIRALPQRTAMEDHMLAEGTRAYIDSPLLAQNELIGALSFEAVEVGAYDPDRVSMIQHVADHLAIAVSAARLFEAEQKRAALMTALHEVALNVSTQLDLSALLQTLVTQAAQLIQAEMGSLFLLQPDGRTLLEVCRYHLPEADTFTHLQLGEGLSGLVALTGDALAIDDYPHWPLRDARVAALPYQSALAAPIKWKDRVLGTITILDTRPGRFSTDDLNAVDALAAQAAAAIENARLFEAVQRQLDDLRVLQAVSMVAADAVDESELIRRVTEIVGLTTTPFSFGVLLVDEAAHVLRAHDSYQGIGAAVQQQPIPIGTGLTGWVAQHGQTRRVADVTQESDYLRLSDRTQSELAVPVKVGRQVIGVLNAESSQPDAFADEDERLLTTIAGQLATALVRLRASAERESLIVDLEAKNAELERFTYTVSHDLKAPLITIRGFLGFLEKDMQAGDRDRLQIDVQRISGATDKMQHLLNDLLELSRIGRLMNPPSAIPFATLVQEALLLVRGRLTAHNVSVTVAPDLPIVYGDQTRLGEVLQNLVDNACKFMGDQVQPRITIGQQGADRDGKPILFVRDNGQGINPAYQQKIFGLFNKLDAQTEGTGIGLALVKRIVEVHGGKIWVESDGLNNGSTFFFTLPEPPPDPIDHSTDTVVT